MTALVLLDRDGVVNVERQGYIIDPPALVLIAGAASAIARLNAAGSRVVVVTNQSAVGRGLMDARTLERIHERLRTLLAAARACVDDIIVCTDPPWAATPRRKPAPGMLLEAMAAAGVAPDATVMIGDDLRDIEAAAAAGCRRILVRTGKGAAFAARGLPAELAPVAVVDDLAAAADLLLGAF
ncbi:MAG: HAD-IIIA family hydrolase [Alphaproteobacteria bacterium]|nr:HAD-IIIA family hydrolase [Alphaproteobacteria bacterium]